MKKIKSLFLGVLLGMLNGLSSAEAQTNLAVAVHLYAGLSISGSIGTSYTVEYVNNLTQTNTWIVITNIVVPTSPYLWVDISNPGVTPRFYRVVPTTSTNQPPPTGMQLVSAGSFVMGDSLDKESDAPTNTEYISAFYMDSTLVSYSLWTQVRGWALTNGYTFDNVGAGNATNQPVQSVNWFDVVKWCNARSQMNHVAPVYFTDSGLTQVYKTGDVAANANWSAEGYRLPTEAEWEKAARGGLVELRFPWGNGISESEANYYGDPADYLYDSGPSGYPPAFGNGLGVDTNPVTYFAVNGYNLHDMAGNVFEWCWDWYAPYPSGVQTDPHGPVSGSFRVLRGGSWLVSAFDARCANRSYYYAQLGGNGYGFRTVMPAIGQ